jgi:hypothetical protein
MLETGAIFAAVVFAYLLIRAVRSIEENAPQENSGQEHSNRSREIWILSLL